MPSGRPGQASDPIQLVGSAQAPIELSDDDDDAHATEEDGDEAGLPSGRDEEIDRLRQRLRAVHENWVAEVQMLQMAAEREREALEQVPSCCTSRALISHILCPHAPHCVPSCPMSCALKSHILCLNAGASYRA